MQYNSTKKEVLYKVVYYGARSSGTTTNLKYIEKNSSYAKGNKLISIATEREKNLNFDFLSLNVGIIAGLKTIFQVFGVPGAEEYLPALKIALQNVDGIVFIVDSCDIEVNLKALKILEHSLLEQNLQLNDIPFVIQWNKRNVANALSIDSLQQSINYLGATEISASANVGDGVFDTFEHLAAKIVEKNYKLASKSDLDKTREMTPLAAVVSNMQKIDSLQKTKRKEIQELSELNFNTKDFQIKEEKYFEIDNGRVLLLRLKGKIDKESVVLLKNKLQKCYVNNDFKIVLDFKEIEHMQSTAFGMIIDIASRAKMMKGEIHLVYVRPKMKTFFEMMGVQHFLGLYDEEQDAISAFKSNSSTETKAAPEAAKIQIQNEKIEKLNSSQTIRFAQFHLRNTGKKKIFISYVKEDEELAMSLEEDFQENYNVCRFKWEKTWSREIIETVFECDTVIIVCSAYTEEKSFFCKEWAVGLFFKKQVIPCFAKETFPLPLPLQTLPSVSFQKYDQGMGQLLTYINSVAKNRLSRKVSNISPLSISFPVQLNEYYNRDPKLLVNLYIELLDKRILAITPSDEKIVSGIGKTELACQLIDNFSFTFESGIFWINAANNLEKEFVSAGKKLDIPYNENHIKFLLSLKTHIQTNRDFLIVVDNVAEPEKLFYDIVPGFSLLSCDCYILCITEKMQLPEQIKPFPVPVYSGDKALAVMVSAHKPSSMLDEKTARELANRVSCYPLAVELVRHFIKKQGVVSFTEYTKSLPASELDAFKILHSIIHKQISSIHEKTAILILQVLSLFPENRSNSIHTLTSFLGKEIYNENSFAKNMNILLELGLVISFTNEHYTVHPLVKNEVMKIYNFINKNEMRNFRKNIAQNLFELYKEFSFIEHQLKQRDIDEILEDFNVAFVWSEGNKEIDKIRTSLAKEKKHLQAFFYFPHFAIQQIYSSIREYNKTGDLLVNAMENSLRKITWQKNSVWFKRINRLLDSSSKLATQRILRYARKANSVTFSKNGNNILVVAADAIKNWDTATGKELPTMLSKVTDATLAQVSPNNKHIIFSKFDTIGIWKTDEPLVTTIKGHNDWILSLAFSPYSRLFSSGGKDGIIKMWGIDTGRLLRVFRGHIGGVKCISFSPRNTEMISGGEDKKVILWSLETNNIQTLHGHFDEVSCINYSNDGIMALSGGKDCLIKLWNTKTFEEVFTFSGHERSITSVVFSPDNTLGLSTSLDKTMRLWCLKTGRCLQVFAADNELLSGHFSTSGNEVWTCSNAIIPTVYHFKLEQHFVES